VCLYYIPYLSMPMCPCMNLYEPMLLMYYYAYYLSMYAYYVVIYLLLIDDAWKKEKLSFVLKLV
jgi:hypothetical protein